MPPGMDINAILKSRICIVASKDDHPKANIHPIYTG
jgi:hypothetical protein